MKQKLLTKLLLMLLCTLGGASFNPAWGDETIELTYENFTNTSYNATENTFTQTVSFGYINAMRNGSNGTPTGWAKEQVIQTKSGSSIYNKAAITGLKSIRVYTVVNTNSFTITTGQSAQPTTNSVTRPSTPSGSASITYSSYANKIVTEGQTTTANYYDFAVASGDEYFKIAPGGSLYIWKIVLTYSSTPKTTAPTIDGGGASANFTISKDVTITAGEGATIYYTMGDTPADPTTSSTVYESAIHITGSTTIKAIAKKDGEDASNVVSKTFTKVLADNTITVTDGNTHNIALTGGSAVTEHTLSATATSGGTVTYAFKSATNLTKDTDFTFDSSKGKISFTNAYKGIIVITASVVENDDYNSASQDITINCSGDKRDPVNAYDGEDAEISNTGSLVIDTDLIETDGDITVESSDTDVATVSEYTISAVSDGTTTITINTAAGTYYNAGSATFELTVVTPSACDIVLTGAPVSKTFDIYNNATPQVIAYTTSSSGAVSIASSPYATFSIDPVNKKITVTPKSKTPSAQTITINQAAAGRYLAGSTTFSLTVNNSATSETYEKVTNDITLAEGDELAIVNETNSNAAGGKSDKYLTAVSVSISDNAFETTSGVVTYVLGGSSGAWTLKQKESSNFLSCNSSADITNVTSNPCTWAISISEGNARVKASVQSSSKDQYLQYNHNGGTNPRFKTYTSSQSPVQLYRRAKYPNTITVINGTAQNLELEKETELTLSATSYCGAVSFAYKSATSLTKDTDFTFDSSTGELLVDENASSGTITITASTAESATHKAASTDIVITVVGKPADPDFSSLSDKEKVAGETYTLVNGVDFVTDGDVTLSSSNTNVATVAGLVVTAVAVGEATITVSAAKGTLYNSGSNTFTFTVTAPAGKTTVSDVVAFSEDFSSLTASGPSSDFNSRGGELTSFGSWTIDKKAYQSGSCVSLGTGTAQGEITTPSFTVVSGKTYHLTFKTAPWNTESGTSMKVTVTGGTIDSKSSATTSSLATKEWTTIEYDIVASSTSMKLNFQAVTNYRVWLDDVSVTTPSTATVTLNKYGYATYCSVNPIDFSSTTGYSAWRVSNIASDGIITFTKITEKIKGGQGVLLYNKDADGENTSNATITFADGSTEFTASQNMLKGTTAATYLTQIVGGDTNFGLSGNEFKKVTDVVTVPANKAYLPVPTSIVENLSSSVKAFTFVFEDFEDGVRTVKTVSPEEAAQIFDLSGRRLNKMQKGINIVNGRKVLK